MVCNNTEEKTSRYCSMLPVMHKGLDDDFCGVAPRPLRAGGSLFSPSILAGGMRERAFPVVSLSFAPTPSLRELWNRFPDDSKEFQTVSQALGIGVAHDDRSVDVSSSCLPKLVSMGLLYADGTATEELKNEVRGIPRHASVESTVQGDDEAALALPDCGTGIAGETASTTVATTKKKRKTPEYAMPRKQQRKMQKPYKDTLRDVPPVLLTAFAEAVAKRRTQGTYDGTTVKYSRVFGSCGKYGISTTKFSVMQVGGETWEGSPLQNNIANVCDPGFGAFLWCVAEVEPSLRDRDLLEAWYKRAKDDDASTEEWLREWVREHRHKIDAIPAAKNFSRTM